MEISELEPEKDYFVCYIDLLGFSNLTTDSTKNERKICKILSKFDSFVSIEKSNNNFAHSSLSDSVFIISNDLPTILHSLSNIFRKCILDGILLRGGLAYGKCKFLKTAIAENIYGDAVSKAVHLEGAGKGCRIFTDENVPMQVDNKSKLYSLLFKTYQSPLDYREVNVFEWENINEKFVYKRKYHNKKEKTEIKKLIVENFKLINILRFSPIYSWNAKFPEGKIQIYATIDFISNTTREIGKGIIDINTLPFITYNDISNNKREKKIVENFNNMIKKTLSP